MTAPELYRPIELRQYWLSLNIHTRTSPDVLNDLSFQIIYFRVDLSFFFLTFESLQYEKPWQEFRPIFEASPTH